MNNLLDLIYKKTQIAKEAMKTGIFLGLFLLVFPIGSKVYEIISPSGTNIIEGVTSKSAKRVVEYIKDTKEPYLIINSNGGSVFAGNEIIQEMKFKFVTCEIKKAISMGFAIAAYCDKLIIHRDAVIMQHMIHNGNGRESMKNLSKEDKVMLEFLDNQHIERESKFIRINKNEFLKKTEFGYWLKGIELYNLQKDGKYYEVELL